jgi:hypothetical protein
MSSSKAPPPDPAQQELARAQVSNMNTQSTMNAEQFAWMKQLAKTQEERGDEQWKYQKGLQDKASDMSDKYDKRYWDTTAKQQDKFYESVDAYDTEGNRNMIAGQAISDYEGQLSNARGAMTRGMTSRGINPNSAAYMSAMGDMELEGAAAKAGASTMAREAARREGLQLRAQASGLGGNLTGASQTSLGQASGAGGAALAASGTGLAAGGAAWQGQNQGSQVAAGWGSSANGTFNGLNSYNMDRFKNTKANPLVGAVAGGIQGAMSGGGLAGAVGGAAGGYMKSAGGG